MWKLILRVVQIDDVAMGYETTWALDTQTPFDVLDFALWADINADDIDAADVKEAQDKQSQLNAGQWLIVTHEKA